MINRYSYFYGNSNYEVGDKCSPWIKDYAENPPANEGEYAIGAKELVFSKSSSYLQDHYSLGFGDSLSSPSRRGKELMPTPNITMR